MSSTKPRPGRGRSPYKRYGKSEYDYSGMYVRLMRNEPRSPLAIHLRSRGFDPGKGKRA